MRTKDTKHTIIGVILFLFMISHGFAQISYDFHKGGGVLRHYYVNANIGDNLFYGDISDYNGDPFNKILKESSFGYSITAGKWLTGWLGGQLTFSGGQLRGSNNGCNCEFKNDFYQYTADAIVNLNQLVYPLDRQTYFFLQARIGYGMIRFNSVLTNSSTQDTIHSIGKHSAFGERITEWVVPIGLSGVFAIDEHYSVSVDFVYNYTNTDKLDTQVLESENERNRDSYILISFGVKYTFDIKKMRGYNNGSNSRSLKWVR